MEGSKILLLVFGLLLIAVPTWAESFHNRNKNCPFETHPRDGLACDFNMTVPIPGNLGLTELGVRVTVDFNGHGGNETREMASSVFFDYFYGHALSKSSNMMVQYGGGLPTTYNQSLIVEILKEALLRTILDIDSKLFQEAVTNNLSSGCQAHIFLMCDSTMILVNVGDLKALLASEKIQFVLGGAEGGLTTYLSVIQLRFHDPPGETNIIQDVTFWGVPRDNGVLALSRSIGDIYLNRFGVVPVPELTGWRILTPSDRYLVVTSNGLFESLTTEDVAGIIIKSFLPSRESGKEGSSRFSASYD